MWSRRTIWLLLALALFWASAALAGKLICVSDEKLRGQMSVENCLEKGERFAVLDDYGAVRILSPEEIRLMKRTNPEAFQQPAYGIMYQKEAPELPKPPPLAVPKLAQ
jgi:hypothetical protein